MVAPVLLAVGLAASTPPPQAKGEVEVGPAVHVAWDYHFDRNAGAASELVGDRLVIRSSSGDLLSISVPGLDLVAERVGDPSFTSLARAADGRLIAGRRDGELFQVDPVTLGTARIGHVDGEPLWASVDASGGIVAVIRTEGSEYDAFLGRRMPVWSDWFVSSAGLWSLPGAPSAYLLDRLGRVWIGADLGEFGGWTARVDPGHRPRVVDRAFSVLGFLERPDGAIWAYVGGMHFGFCSAAIVRVDRPAPEPLWEQPAWECSDRPLEGPARPGLPLSWVGSSPDGSVLVLAYHQLFRADPALRDWTLLQNGLPVRYFFGKPFAVGTPPALVAPHLVDAAGLTLVAATMGDGALSWNAGGATTRRLPGQLEARGDLEPVPGMSELALLETGWGQEGGIWRFRADGWEPEGTRAYSGLRSLWCRSPEACSATDEAQILDGGDGGFDSVADLPASDHPAMCGPRVVDPEADPVVLVEPWTGTLWRVNRQSDRVEAVEIPGRRRAALDAAPHPSGWLLVATARRWSLVDPRTGRHRRADVARPAGRIDTIARDGRGRLWAFGERGWIHIDGAWRNLDSVPLLRSPRVRTARPLAGDADAIVLTLEGRGAVVLRVVPESRY